MKLEKLEYLQFENEPQEWKIVDCSFDNINLIVSKNAIGKTRTLNVIKTLANLLSGERKLRGLESNFKVHFTKHGKSFVYVLKSSPGNFVCEKLTINSEVRIDRGADGKGEIYAEQLEQTIKFQTSIDEVAVFARRDTVQHPFLEDLYEWGKNLLHYAFNTPLGKPHLGVATSDKKEEKAVDVNLKQTEKVVEIFMRGEKEYSIAFTDAIKRDMASIGYQIDEIGVKVVKEVRIQPDLPLNPLGIYVKEHDLQSETIQLEMSDGMFRALSVLIQVNYATFSSIPSCILIDDIGEGLDFDRSSSLVKLLIERARGFSVQLIMATNDRFIMNNVPLEYWIVLNRDGSKLTQYNYRNSKEIFDKFELTGLSNFDFFSSDYYLQSENGK